MIGPILIYTAADGTRFLLCEDHRTRFIHHLETPEGGDAQHAAHNLRMLAATIENAATRFTEINRTDGKTVQRPPRVIPMKDGSYVLVAHDAIFRRVYENTLAGATELSFSVESIAALLRDEAKCIVDAANVVLRAYGFREITPSP